MKDVIIFINKMKVVLNLIPDEEMDEYNNIYNDKPTEELIAWINKKYEEYMNIVDTMNKIPN